jgi:hypothetical protein
MPERTRPLAVCLLNTRSPAGSGSELIGAEAVVWDEITDIERKREYVAITWSTPEGLGARQK